MPPFFKTKGENIKMLHLITGTVTEIEYSEEELRFMLQTDSEQKIVFFMSEGQFLIDAKGNQLPWSCVTVDTRISAVLSDTTPMTMSIPPQISGAYGYVLTESEQQAKTQWLNIRPCFLICSPALKTKSA